MAQHQVSEDNHCVVTRCKGFVEFLMPLPPVGIELGERFSKSVYPKEGIAAHRPVVGGHLVVWMSQLRKSLEIRLGLLSCRLKNTPHSLEVLLRHRLRSISRGRRQWTPDAIGRVPSEGGRCGAADDRRSETEQTGFGEPSAPGQPISPVTGSLPGTPRRKMRTHPAKFTSTGPKWSLRLELSRREGRPCPLPDPSARNRGRRAQGERREPEPGDRRPPGADVQGNPSECPRSEGTDHERGTAPRA